MKLYLAPFKLRNELKFCKSYGNIIDKEGRKARSNFIHFYQQCRRMEEKKNAPGT